MSKLLVFEDSQEGIVKDQIAECFDAFYNQRADIDSAYELSDWQYKGGTALAEYDSEKRKWIPRLAPGKSNVGSMLMHRQVNTLAGSLASILMSGRDLFKYSDPVTDGNPESGGDGRASADVMNALSKWNLKADNFLKKIPEFCTEIFKQSNVFALVQMNERSRDVFESELVPPKGGVGFATTKRKKVRRKEQYVSVTFPYPRNIYLDKFIPNIDDQECVILLSTTNIHKLLAESDAFDPDRLKLINPGEMRWDGNYGGDGKESDLTHLNRDGIEVTAGTLLRWDVYKKVLMRGDEIATTDNVGSDAKLSTKLVLATIIGNTIKDGVILRCIEGFDPDGEIPLTAIRVSSDDADMLYHTTLAEVLRSGYAADCALMNAAIDRDSVSNDPPLEILEGMHSVKDFTMKSGQRWHVRTKGAITPVAIPNTAMQTVQLREQIRDECKQALATDSTKVGEFAGARTSAYEVREVTASTDNTLAMRNMYIAAQLLPWMARKYVSYIREFMSPEIIQRVANEQMPGRIHGTFIGEYDFTADIVTQYIADNERSAMMDNMMQVFSNQLYQQSETHKIDIGELTRMYVESRKLPSDKLILPAGSPDSEANARNRMDQMLVTGVYSPPLDGENVAVHTRVARAERKRWAGLENNEDPRAKNIPLLDRYIEELSSMSSAPQQAMQAGPQGIPVGMQTEVQPSPETMIGAQGEPQV